MYERFGVIILCGRRGISSASLFSSAAGSCVINIGRLIRERERNSPPSDRRAIRPRSRDDREEPRGLQRGRIRRGSPPGRMFFTRVCCKKSKRVQRMYHTHTGHARYKRSGKSRISVVVRYVGERLKWKVRSRICSEKRRTRV